MKPLHEDFKLESSIYIIIIFLIIIVLLFYKHNLAAGVLSLILIPLIVYSLFKHKTAKKQWENFVSDYYKKVLLASDSSFTNLPFPLLMLDNKGNIIWYNINFGNIVNNENLLGRNIKEISKDINVKHSIDGKNNVLKDILLENKYYDIISTVIYPRADSATTVLYYFYDVSNVHEIKRDIKENKYSIMLIEVDNLDDVLKATEDDKSPLLAAKIEGTINAYAQSLNAMVKKYKVNKYVLTVQDKAIQSEMESKFNILDNIRELDYGNKILVTLSVGVGRNGDTPQQNYEFAESAKDLALGRGGDQVVVKSEDNIEFFGGKSKEIEKKNKVRARIITHVLLDLLSDSSRVIIMGHKYMDVDCLGAAIGLNSSFRQLGIKTNIIYNESDAVVSSLKSSLVELDDYGNVFIGIDAAKAIVDENTLLIIVDVHNENHVESMDVVNMSSRVVIIDHHRKSTDYIKDSILNYVEPYASSTSELITEMLQYLVKKPDLKKLESTIMLAGIYLDTKNFYFKTGVRTFEAAATLRRFGADTLKLKKLFRDSLEKTILKSDIIKSAIITDNIAVAVCPEGIVDYVIAAQVADDILDIKDVEAAFVLVKIKNEILISGRSLDTLNVQVILEKLGGGGHMMMAGASLADITLEEAQKRLQIVIKEYLQEGV